MRCGCPHCEGYMIQSEAANQTCACPYCNYHCNACLGTGTAITREYLHSKEGISELYERLQNRNEEDQIG